MSYSVIAIIYNPNSTGDSEKEAKDLKRFLQARLRDGRVMLLPTQRAGHAVELAYEIAKKHHDPLIISSSGDGGYHEVVNGAMRAQAEGSDPICAVLPAGNANDHARTMQDKSLAQAIIEVKINRIDLLKVVASDSEGKPTQTFAHSYVGLGLTPTVAVELNKRTLNSFVEAWTVITSFWGLRPVRLRVNSKLKKYDSLICATIPEMAKFLTLAGKSEPDDGLFEIVTFEHARKLKLIYRLLKGAISHLEPQQKAKKFSFQVLQDTPIQLDGEVQALTKNTSVTVSIVPKAMRTIF